MLADDQNGDGVITFEEFKNQILKVGHLRETMPTRKRPVTAFMEQPEGASSEIFNLRLLRTFRLT